MLALRQLNAVTSIWTCGKENKLSKPNNFHLILKALSFKSLFRFDILDMYDGNETKANTLAALATKGHATAVNKPSPTRGVKKTALFYTITQAGRDYLAKYETTYGEINDPIFDRFKTKKTEEAQPAKQLDGAAQKHTLLLVLLAKHGTCSLEAIWYYLDKQVNLQVIENLLKDAYPTIEPSPDTPASFRITDFGRMVLGNMPDSTLPALPSVFPLSIDVISILNIVVSYGSGFNPEFLVNSVDRAIFKELMEGTHSLINKFNSSTGGQAVECYILTEKGRDAIKAIKNFDRITLEESLKNVPYKVVVDHPVEEPTPTPVAQKVEPAPVLQDGPVVPLEVLQWLDRYHVRSVSELTKSIENLAEGFATINDTVNRTLRLAEVAFKSAEETALRLDIGGLEDRAKKVLAEMEAMRDKQKDSSAGNENAARNAAKKLAEIENLNTQARQAYSNALASAAAADKAKKEAVARCSEVQSLADRTKNIMVTATTAPTASEVMAAAQDPLNLGIAAWSPTLPLSLPKCLVIGLKPVQSGLLVNEFSGRLDIICCDHGAGVPTLQGMVKNASVAFLHTAHSSHAITEIIKTNASVKLVNVPGGLTGMRRALDNYLETLSNSNGK